MIAYMNILKVFGIALLLLCIPLIGMIAFPSEVNWSIFDFTLAFLLFFMTGIFISFIANNIQEKKKKVLYIVFITVVMVLIWLELAVGIVETIFAGS
jgi:hypothetical membrane protein